MTILGRMLAFGTAGLLWATSASAIITVVVPDTTGSPGGAALVEVDVAGLAEDGPAGTIDIDLLIDGDVFDIQGDPDCTIQLSNLQARAFFPTSQPDAPQRRIRLSAADLDQANDPLSVDGVLWSCNLPVADSATIGSETTIAVESVAAFDLLGLNELESEGEDGVVAISEAPPSPTETATPVAATPTNTPTRTNTVQPTNTTAPTNTRGPGGGDDDDGCQVVAPANSSAGWLLLIPAAALLWQRRRSR